ncbi:hypothetical protein RS130_19740 [Paraglaciecola aquimarina]|uniref:Adhesin domain-containing protein n=1 Tax=Paraglaciecola aquimarina TaxID=1235557 RepID=A0ABU3T0M2_9ALTE|nr:hypothetical protein [Paraglaciecola aquimarina]MDU0355818.1 hypothetical protein [Paraglaciecola aquimarina]
MKLSPLALTAILAATVITTSGCIIHVNAHEDDHHHSQHKEKYKRVFGGIEIEKNREVGDLSSVNGGIDIADGVTANKVETVNGGIEIGKNVTLKQASTVNGGIEADPYLNVEKDLSTVNGGIEVAAHSTIGKSVSTVNGEINLEQTLVSNNVSTKNGDINLRNATIVEGDVIFRSKKNNSWSKDKNHSLPTLSIDASSNVKGRIILERKVILEIENDQLLAKIEHQYAE